MTNTNNLDIAIYLRKSRADADAEREAAERGETYDTLGKHRTELLSVARRENFNIVDIFEEVVSGAFIGERPEMQKLLENMRTFKYDGVLVMDTDRFGRGDKIDQGRIERAFKETETLIITPTEVIDPTSETGEFLLDVKGFASNMEFRMIKKRLIGGRRRAARSGKDIGQKPPYGYTKGKDKILRIDEEKAKIVRMIYQWCIEGLGRVKIAKRLTEMGIPSPSGKPVWSHVTVRNILENPKYKGDQVYQRTKWTKQEDGRYKTKKINDPSLFIAKENAHEPIIDAETWELAQKAIKGRVKSPPLKKSLDLINPFASILRCKVCGKAILANNPTDRPQKYLYCDTKKECGQRMIPLGKVETAVLEQLEQILLKLRSIQKYQENKQQQAQDLAELYKKRLEKMDTEIEKQHKRKRRVQEFYEDGDYSKDEYLQRNAEIAEEIKKLEWEKGVAQKQYEAETERAKRVEQVIPSIERALSTYQNAATVADQNQTLKTIIKEIRYYRPTGWKGRDQFELEIELHE